MISTGPSIIATKVVFILMIFIGDGHLYVRECNVFGKFTDTQDSIHDRKQQKTLEVDSVLLRVK